MDDKKSIDCFFLGGAILTNGFAWKNVYNFIDYYSKFGMKGHNGEDFVPAESGKIQIFIPYEQWFYKCGYDDGWGYYIKTYDRNSKVMCLYAHLKNINHINVWKIGQKDLRMPKSLMIGEMGGTGNVVGDHLHFGVYRVDSNMQVLDRDNGFFGAINPTIYLTGSMT